MTLMGKVLIINTLMASLFVYKLQVLPILNDVMVKQIESIFTDFLWKGKRAKIPLGTMQKAKHEGGLGLVNIKFKT